jgi:parallel beta-helix repeat protein
VETLEHRWVPSTIVVNNPTDIPVAGLIDLRQAIAMANSNLGVATITFDKTVFSTPKTITLGGTQLELTEAGLTATITGPSAGVTVSGGGLSRVFQVDEFVSASISGLTISGGKTTGDGGGLRIVGKATLTNCTITGNTARSGGGLLINSRALAGATTLTNCTVSDNSASNIGGGLANYGSSRTGLTNCTVSGNSAPNRSGGGLSNIGFSNYGSALALRNTIVAGNTGGDLAGPLTASSTNNLIGGNPLLAPLGGYGGPTQTMALLPGSPAIDAGTNGAGIPSTDQRGEGRVGGVDIGAFESQGFTLTSVAGSTPQTSPIGTPFANPLAVTVTANNPIEPVNGGVVSFANSATHGALAILSAPLAVIGGGQAETLAEPNNAIGSYTVVASATGASSISFALTNAGPVIASLVVNTKSDSLFPGAGLLSLREAIGFANLDSSGISSITFDKNVFATTQTIMLTGSQLELSNTTETESITGPAASVTISGGGNSRVFQVDAHVMASLSRLTISGGYAGLFGTGGGLLNDGAASLTNCTVSGNTAGPIGFSYYGSGTGGGVANFGTLSMSKCAIAGNSANQGYFYFDGGTGGGLYNGGKATLADCTVSGNFTSGGGAVTTDSFFGQGTAKTTLTNCTVSGNTGAGVSNYGTSTLTKCTVSDNSGDGVISRAAVFAPSGITSVTTLTSCTVSGNTGTGVFTGAVSLAIFGPYGADYFIEQATSNLTNCTVSGNSGTGLLTSGGTTTATNTTINGNTASGDGGGVNTSGFSTFFRSNLYGTTTLTNCTVSGNSAGRDGGGLSTSGLGRTTAINTTISGNTANRDGGGLSTAGVHSNNYGDQIATTSLTNCTVSGNSAGRNGGGLNNSALGTTTVTGSNVKGNSAVAGGGIANQGTLNVASSNIINNTATSKGGGISTTGGTATITNSVINSNQVNTLFEALGGGIDCENSVLSLTNSTVNANQANGATAQGGGIYALKSTVNVTNSVLNGNKANGTVDGEGGGIYSLDSILTLIASNVKGNKASTAFDDIFNGHKVQGGSASGICWPRCD